MRGEPRLAPSALLVPYVRVRVPRALRVRGHAARRGVARRARLRRRADILQRVQTRWRSTSGDTR